MNPTMKQQWITALRSGEYEQGTGFLRTINNKYCCLGVLCDVAGVNAVQGRHVGDHDRYYYEGTSCMLHMNLQIKFGIEGETGILMGMNDKGDNFNEIADWIEENIDA